MKRIWFVNHYTMPPQYEMRVRTPMFARYFRQKGYETTIFAASTIHNTGINLIKDDKKYISEQYDGVTYVFIKCSDYSGNGLKRIANMQQFAHRFQQVAKEFKIPDVVYASVNCINYRPVYSFCKKHDIPFYVDMRDFWPMSIVGICGFGETNLLIRYLYHRERVMYRQATGVVFSMEGGRDYVREKGWNEISKDKLYYVNNGVDLEEFNRNAKETIYEDKDLEETDTYKVVYTGSIRPANEMEPVIHAAKILTDRGEDKIKIFLFGDGTERAKLEEYCRENHLKNVVFKGMVEKRYIPNILSKCDLGILSCKKTMGYQYGWSMNKIFDYLASGHPILIARSMNHNIVTENSCGITIDEPRPQEIADAIIKLSRLSKREQQEMGKRAKAVVAEYDYPRLAEKLEKIITKGAE